ncbi:MAG: hypothetical protein C5B51_09035 [Terriglobia bacterium]|nr:MAG: hypothetical protein C5B51_09035 [Terriglobia bacterium]
MSRTVEINENLWTRLVKFAELKGHASPQQFIEETLERELAQPDGAVSDQEITHKMEQLGYLDFGRDI